MKKTALLLTVLLFIPFFVSAQKGTKKESRGAKIKALKVAFITEKLNLTSSEAEKFWPVYNKFDEILHQLERVEKYKLKNKVKDLDGIDNVSEKEAKSIINKIKDLDKQAYKTKLEYDNELSKVLTFKKILKLKTVEWEFVRKLMRKYKRKKSDRK